MKKYNYVLIGIVILCMIAFLWTNPKRLSLKFMVPDPNGWQRRYAGGYHADTKGRCYIVSVFLITISMCFIKYIDSGIVICFVLQTFNIIIIYLLAPVGTANRELDRMETAVFRKKARIMGSISYVLACCFYMNSYFRIANSIGASNWVIGYLLISGYLKNRIGKKKDISI